MTNMTKDYKRVLNHLSKAHRVVLLLLVIVIKIIRTIQEFKLLNLRKIYWMIVFVMN